MRRPTAASLLALVVLTSRSTALLAAPREQSNHRTSDR
jgi:hypothetical protein